MFRSLRTFCLFLAFTLLTACEQESIVFQDVLQPESVVTSFSSEDGAYMRDFMAELDRRGHAYTQGDDGYVNFMLAESEFDSILENLDSRPSASKFESDHPRGAEWFSEFLTEKGIAHSVEIEDGQAVVYYYSDKIENPTASIIRLRDEYARYMEEKYSGECEEKSVNLDSAVAATESLNQPCTQAIQLSID